MFINRLEKQVNNLIKIMEYKINIKFPEDLTITSITSNKCDLDVTLNKKYNPKDGDIVYTKGNRMQFNNKILSSIGIFKEIKNNMIYCHCELFLENHFLIKNPYPVSLNYNQIIRPATDSEIKILTEDMADSEIFFDYENKKLITIYQPKDGDIIYSNSMYNNIGYISIFKKFDFENDKLFTYLDYYCKDESIIFATKQSFLRNISSTIELRKATEEEKKKLFNSIKAYGSKWNPDTKSIEDIYIPKHGDFVQIGKNFTNDVDYLAIFDKIEFDESINKESYRSIVDIDSKLEANFDVILPSDKPIKLATEEQRKTILNVLNGKGYKWNNQTKSIEKINIPKVGDICIGWSYKTHAIIGKLIYVNNHLYSIGGEKYENCIKFESMEQYQEIINDKNKSNLIW